MKNQVLLIFGTLTLFAAGANAGALTLTPSGKTIENVAIAKTASATITDRRFELTTVGAGLRSKKISVINIKVYVAQLLVSNASAFTRTTEGALDSVAAMNEVAVRLDFLRTVDAQTVQSSFRDSLLANEIDLNDPSIKLLLDVVASGGDAVSGKALTFVGERLGDGSEAISYEDSTGRLTTIPCPAGSTRKLFSIWLGKPADAGVEKLKQELIGGY